MDRFDVDGSVSVAITSEVMWPVRPVHDGDGSDRKYVIFKLEIEFFLTSLLGMMKRWKIKISLS